MPKAIHHHYSPDWQRLVELGETALIVGVGAVLLIAGSSLGWGDAIGDFLLRLMEAETPSRF